VKPIDATGKELDANYTVETTELGFDLILESRGGGVGGPRPVRNGSYGPALTLLLERMAARGMTLATVQLASTRSVKMSPEERVLDLKSYLFPIQLSGVAHAEELRLAIGRSSAITGQKPGAKGGNSNKRLRLVVGWAPAVGSSAAQIAKLLALPDAGAVPPAILSEAPTDDPFVLEQRVARARAKRAGSINGASIPIPTGSEGRARVTFTAARFMRDPEIVAWVLENAEGTCEVCGGPAPFRKSNGYPYLEVHHVRPLAEGSPDKVDNAIGVCPNCHRNLHHGELKNELRAETIAKIDRIFDYPFEAVEASPDDEVESPE